MYAVDLACGKNTGHYDAGLKQQDKGVIRGTIWNDANYDGLYNSNEVPVATSVRVILTREIYENGNWIPDTAFGEVSEIVDHGEYQFTDLTFTCRQTCQMTALLATRIASMAIRSGWIWQLCRIPMR